MNLLLNNLRIPVEKDGRAEYLKAASQKLNVCGTAIHIVKMLSKTLDTGDQEQFYYNISLVVHTPDSFENREDLPVYIEKPAKERMTKTVATRHVVIGFGPAGMFASLELISYGLKPVIFERGKRLEERSIDVQRFMKEKLLDPESNIQRMFQTIESDNCL